MVVVATPPLPAPDSNAAGSSGGGGTGAAGSSGGGGGSAAGSSGSGGTRGSGSGSDGSRLVVIPPGGDAAQKIKWQLAPAPPGGSVGCERGSVRMVYLVPAGSDGSRLLRCVLEAGSVQFVSISEVDAASGVPLSLAAPLNCTGLEPVKVVTGSGAVSGLVPALSCLEPGISECLSQPPPTWEDGSAQARRRARAPAQLERQYAAAEAARLEASPEPEPQQEQQLVPAVHTPEGQERTLSRLAAAAAEQPEAAPEPEQQQDPQPAPAGVAAAGQRGGMLTRSRATAAPPSAGAGQQQQ